MSNPKIHVFQKKKLRSMYIYPTNYKPHLNGVFPCTPVWTIQPGGSSLHLIRTFCSLEGAVGWGALRISPFVTGFVSFFMGFPMVSYHTPSEKHQKTSGCVFVFFLIHLRFGTGEKNRVWFKTVFSPSETIPFFHPNITGLEKSHRAFCYVGR